MTDFPNIPSMDTKGVTIMVYSDGKITYRGVHTSQDAATSDPSWECTKYTWTGTDLTQIEVLTGVWDNYSTLAWRS